MLPRFRSSYQSVGSWSVGLSFLHRWTILSILIFLFIGLASTTFHQARPASTSCYSLILLQFIWYMYWKLGTLQCHRYELHCILLSNDDSKAFGQPADHLGAFPAHLALVHPRRECLSCAVQLCGNRDLRLLPSITTMLANYAFLHQKQVANHCRICCGLLQARHCQSGNAWASKLELKSLKSLQ